MFRNYLSAALNNLIRNKLYAAINIVGLAVGFAAAILIGLYVRDEFSYDRWIPGAESIYSIYSIGKLPGGPPVVIDASDPDFADALKSELSEIRDTTRLMPVKKSLRHGGVEATENIYWADANVFSFLNVPVVAGDLVTALRKPESIVITRRVARKYFGIDAPIGKTIEIERSHPMQVTAVLQDFPSSTNLSAEIFAPGTARFSDLAYEDAHRRPSNSNNYSCNTHILLHLVSGVTPEQLRPRLAEFFRRHRHFTPADMIELDLVPLAQIHLRSSSAPRRMTASADATAVHALAAIGVLILLIAVINFINLMTAGASRRALEVGIRKVSGASRGDIVRQFIGEAMLYVTFSMVLAVALVELLLPLMNAFLSRTITFDYWREAQLIGGIALLVVMVSLAAGVYPAFLLSAFRPAAALRAGKSGTGQLRGMREVLVTMQFAALVGLAVAAGTVYGQTRYALNNALRIDTDQVLLIEGPCHTALEQKLRSVAGVRSLACSSTNALNLAESQSPAILPDGRQVFVFRRPVDFGFFEFYGIKPIVGRLFSERFGGDTVSQKTGAFWHPSLIINEQAVPKLGFSSPQAAIGKTIRQTGEPDVSFVKPSVIVGVIPDFSLGSVRNRVEPTVYYVNQSRDNVLSLRLDGNRTPGTLAAIDRVWRQVGPPQPINRMFFDSHMQGLYLDIIRQGQVLAGFAVLAVLIACLGLFGLSASAAEQRAKEIGIRKAMGAETVDILRLLLWQFAKPVLWANLIAWPVAGYLMWRWLQGFAYRIALPLWLFPTAAMLAFVIAILTVLVHSLLVARAKPVVALRYE